MQNTLVNMGMSNLKNIRQGKHFEIEVNEDNQSTAEKIDENVKNFSKSNY